MTQAGDSPTFPSMKIEDEFGFYGILTNPVVGYEALATLMTERQVRFVQLRMKDAPRDQLLAMAKRLRPIIRKPSLFIVNDDPRVAAEAEADGVHLGQNDMSIEQARKIVGPDRLIGLSTHNPTQTRAACAQHPHYIGVGPLFPTPTKKIPDPAIGLDGMGQMLAVATVPAVVLGSIDHSNLPQVLQAGAKNICAVRCINQSEDPGSELDKMIRVIQSAAHR